MADHKETEVYYRLARSVVTITGQVTHDFDPTTSAARTAATSDIEIGVGADPRLDWRCRLPLGRDFMRDKTFDLAFASDGRLTSSSATVSGVGASLIEAGVRVAGFVAATGMAALAKTVPPAPPPPPKPRTFEDALEQDNADLFNRRNAYRTAITNLQDALARNAQSVAANPATPGLLAEGRALQGTLERLRLEAEHVVAQVDAWLHTRFPSVSETHEFAIGTDDLKEIPAADATIQVDINDLSPTMQQAAATLGVVVFRVADVEEAAASFTSEDLQQDVGVWFRVARPTHLAIYDRELGDDGPFTRRRVTPEWVVDSYSRLGYLGFESGVFDKQTDSVEFGDAGTLSKLGSSDESAGRQLSAALAAAPGQLKESFDQAVAVVDSYGKLRAAGAERQLADIDRRRKILEAEIAEKGVLATKAQRAELERLDVEVKLAEDRKKLVVEPPPAPSPTKDLEEQVARAKLELELKQAEIEIDRLTGSK